MTTIPICSRCQLPTEPDQLMCGKCVACFADESLAAISGTGDTFASFVGGLSVASWDSSSTTTPLEAIRTMQAEIHRNSNTLTNLDVPQ